MTYNQYYDAGVPTGVGTGYSVEATPVPPPAGTIRKIEAGKVTATPQPVKLDITTFLIGAIVGGFVAILFIYGVAPAAFQYGAAKIREKTPR